MVISVILSTVLHEWWPQSFADVSSFKWQEFDRILVSWKSADLVKIFNQSARLCDEVIGSYTHN